MNKGKLKEIANTLRVMANEIEFLEEVEELTPTETTEGLEQYPVTCSKCGVKTTVPFKPKKHWPVYCKECYFKKLEIKK